MPLMQAKLHKALLEAKVSDDTAREAAEEAAGPIDRLAVLESDTRLLKWMVGTNVTLTIAVLFLLFQVLSRLPR